MKLKALIDGTKRGIKVVNAETGEELECLMSVTVRFDADHVPYPIATIEVGKVQVEMSNLEELHI